MEIPQDTFNKPDQKKTGSVLFQAFSILLLLICIFGALYFIRMRNDYTLDSDEASNMVLGKLLAEEGSILSKNWYYATELKLLNNNLFIQFFFLFSNSWHRVRMLATGCMFLLLAVTYFGMSRACKFGKYAALTAAVLFIPFSGEYFYICLKGIFYTLSIQIIFLVLMLAEYYLQASGWKAKCLLLFSFLTALLAGMGGPRLALVLYLPLLTAAAIILFSGKSMPNAKKWLVFTGVSFFGNAAGVAANTFILPNYYHYDSYGSEYFQFPDFSRLESVLNGFLTTYGYETGKIFSTALLRNGVCMVWIGLTLWAVIYALKRRQEVRPEYFRFAVFTACAFGIFVLFYLFSASFFNPRYNLTTIILSFPVIAMFLEQSEWPKKISAALLSVLVLLTAVSGLVYYKEHWNIDDNWELRKIAGQLVSEGYHNGYSSFWRSNILTEFSNGELELWDLYSSTYDTAFYKVHDIDQMEPWMQAISHDTTHPEGKVFILFTAPEAIYNNWAENLRPEDEVYRSYEYVVYGYDDYEDMVDHLYPGYDLIFDENLAMENGADADGHRELYVGGVTHGPYKTFWPGTYVVTVKGRGLKDAAAFCIAEYGASAFDVEVTEQSDNEFVFSFPVPEKSYNVETLIRNMSDEPGSVVVLDSVSIKKVPGSGRQLTAGS